MGTCGCSRNADDQKIKEFWANLPIRRILPSKYEELVKNLKKNNSKVENEQDLSNLLAYIRKSGPCEALRIPLARVSGPIPGKVE